jgi:flagellar hook-associated protein 3
MPTIFNNIQTQLQRLVEDLQHTNATIATGRKYQQISDNPLEVGALIGLDRDSTQITQYQRNLDTAYDWLAATETTLTNINQLVSSTAALAEQMATGTYTAQQRAAAAQQVQQYLEEFMQMGNTRYQGHYLLSGYKIDTEPFAEQAFAIQPPQMQAGSTNTASSSGAYTGTESVTYMVEIVAAGATGAATYRVSEDGGQTWSATNTTAVGPLAIGSDGVQVSFGAASNWSAGERFTISVYQPITYQGDNNTLDLAIGRGTTMQVSQVGSEVVGGAGGGNDLFQIMAQLKSNLEANNAGEVGKRLEELRDYQAHLTAVIAGQGAALNRVEIKQNAYDTIQEEVTQSIAKKGDTDLVEAANAMASKQLAYQAALQASTMVMNLSLLNYL